MARGNVRYLMRHHAGQLGLFISRQNQAGIHIEESARQRERVHFIGVDYLDGKRYLGIRIAHQILPYAIDILVHDWVLHQLYAVFDLHRILLAHSDFGLERVPVAQAASADLAIANRIDIVFPTIVFHLAVRRLLHWLLSARRSIARRVARGVRRRSRTRCARRGLRRWSLRRGRACVCASGRCRCRSGRLRSRGLRLLRALIFGLRLRL